MFATSALQLIKFTFEHLLTASLYPVFSVFGVKRPLRYGQ